MNAHLCLCLCLCAQIKLALMRAAEWQVADGPNKGKTGTVRHVFRAFLFLCAPPPWVASERCGQLCVRGGGDGAREAARPAHELLCLWESEVRERRESS